MHLRDFGFTPGQICKFLFIVHSEAPFSDVLTACTPDKCIFNCVWKATAGAGGSEDLFFKSKKLTVVIDSIFSAISQWLETHQLPCPVKYYLHIDCPGCGLQSSFIELTRGNFLASFRLHPVTVPLILFVIFSVLHLIYKFRKGNLIVVYSYIFIALIVLINYIFKITCQHLT